MRVLLQGLVGSAEGRAGELLPGRRRKHLDRIRVFVDGEHETLGDDDVARELAVGPPHFLAVPVEGEEVARIRGRQDGAIGRRAFQPRVGGARRRGTLAVGRYELSLVAVRAQKMRIVPESAHMSVTVSFPDGFAFGAVEPVDRPLVRFDRQHSPIGRDVLLVAVRQAQLLAEAFARWQGRHRVAGNVGAVEEEVPHGQHSRARQGHGQHGRHGDLPASAPAARRRISSRGLDESVLTRLAGGGCGRRVGGILVGSVRGRDRRGSHAPRRSGGESRRIPLCGSGPRCRRGGDSPSEGEGVRRRRRCGRGRDARRREEAF